MAVPTELKGKDAEITIRGVPVALVEFTMDAKTGEVSQERVGNKYPRTSPGTTKLSFKMTNLDISGEQMAMAMATDAVASTRTVLHACDASANWTSSAPEDSVLTLDTSNKKKGTGALLVTNAADGSGNTIIADPTNADLTGFTMIEAWVRSSVTGSNVMTMGFGNAALTEQSKAVTIREANTWQRVTWDISAIADSSKNSVSAVGFTLGAGAVITSTIYIDSVNALKGTTLGTPEYFDVTVRAADPTDDTKYIDWLIPDCYFMDFSMNIPGGADKVIEGPISGGVKDASKIQMFRS